MTQPQFHPSQPPFGSGPGYAGPQHPMAPPQQFVPAGQVGGHAGFAQVLVAEWTKIRTVRSTMWTLLVMALIVVGLSALISGTADVGPSDSRLEVSQVGMIIGQIAAATLGVLTISAEYGTGMIRTTLTVYPRRAQVLLAKALVLGSVILVTSLVCSYLAYLVFTASGKGEPPSSDDLMRAVVGGSVYMAAISLVGLGFGAILRHSAGAITTLLGIILLPMIIGGFLPSGAREVVVGYSPMMSLLKIIAGMDEEAYGPGPWPSLWLVCAYAAAAITAGVALMKSRDV